MNLSNNDVISFIAPKRLGVIGQSEKVTSTIDDLYRKLIFDFETILLDGCDCKVLLEGKSWQSGKFRIAIEFIPDDELAQLGEITES